MDKADIKKVAQVVAQGLKESEKSAIWKIEVMIEQLGIDFVQTTLEETQRIEADGGLMTLDNERRRTRGGVFFFTAKAKLTKEQKKAIFPQPGAKQRKAAAKKRKEQAEKAKDTNKEGA